MIERIPLDLKSNLSVCDCEFEDYLPSECILDEKPEDSFHYLRLCGTCHHEGYSLHCPHDGVQNRCSCGARFRHYTEI